MNRSYEYQLVKVWLFVVTFLTGFVIKIHDLGQYSTDQGLYSTL